MILQKYVHESTQESIFEGYNGTENQHLKEYHQLEDHNGSRQHLHLPSWSLITWLLKPQHTTLKGKKKVILAKLICHMPIRANSPKIAKSYCHAFPHMHFELPYSLDSHSHSTFLHFSTTFNTNATNSTFLPVYDHFQMFTFRLV